MNYNELKLKILGILSRTKQIDSDSLARELASSGVALDIHALRMALMRYYRHGLLKREKRGGMFYYALSERGLSRLRWLDSEFNKAKTS